MDIIKLAPNGLLHFIKLPKNDYSSNLVKAGEHLFTYKSLVESLAEQKKSNKVDSRIFTLEDQRNLRKENFDYYSKTDGILIKYNKSIRFISISYDAFCEIEIDDSKEYATANFYPASFSGKELTGEMVIKQIRGLKIVADIDLKVLKKAISIVNNKKQALKNVVVVKGKPISRGKEGWVEYLFDTEKKVAAVVDENGHTDFYNKNLLESVSENQTVAIFHPTIQGDDGIDIFGEKVIAAKIKEVKPPRGQNIFQSKDNPNHIVSKIDGHIVLTNDGIVITDTYNVRGDVDFSTGHLKSKGSLNVRGNVITGFNLEMSKNVKINGYVKDSSIIAGGDVSIHGGFSGKGNGKIVSGGNVCARFIRNQKVYSRGNITIDKEVVDSELFAKNEISYRNNEAVVVGGHLIAGGDIKISTAGHEFSVATILEVGYDYDLVRQVKEMEVVLISLKKEIANLKAQFSEHMSKNFLMNFQNKNKEYEALVKERSNLREQIKSGSESKVEISGDIYPGVRIVIKGHKLEIKELMHSKKFVYSSKEDKIIALDR